jgi:putative PIN family toxin of toxin-antitoxin system
MLGTLRNFNVIKRFIGSIAQFTIVLDANIILGDLIWLVSKREQPGAITELMECIRAGTIVAYISRSVLGEIEEHIPNIASDKDLSSDALLTEWKQYRKLVKVRAPKKKLIDQYMTGRDPDDAPVVALGKMLRADGILSKDKDIVAMGGLVIEADFTRQARDYSRKTAIVVTIKASGVIAAIVGYGALEVIGQLIAGAAAQFMRLPPVVKLGILAAILVVALNERARNRVMDVVTLANAAPSKYLPAILDFLKNSSVLLAENTVQHPIPSFKKQAQN